VLVAMMARAILDREPGVDPERVYLAGISGGGRIASQTITRFPRRFAGALYIVGADFHLPETPARALALERRFVFLTGSKDFNQREMRQVGRQYIAAGATRVLLIDEPGFGHQLATPALLRRALDFLDAR
jgi:pimeloyl-ACP methyl ester carboxylesterase